MNNFKLCLTVILISLFFLIGVVSGESTTNEEVAFEIETKDKYLLREPVWIDLYLTNNCEEDITIRPLDLPWLVLQVLLVNSKGDTLKYRGMHFEHGRLPGGYVVEPNETYHHFVNLLTSFGETTYALEKGLGRFYLEEDTYTLQMNYKGLVSNKIRFKVERPKSNEEEAHELLKEAYYYDLKLENQKTIDILQRLIDKYPKSVYADLAYYELAGHYGLVGEPERTHGYLKKLILNYPDSHFSLKALPGLIREMKKDEKIGFLKEIIEKQPKTKASHWAKESLKALEEQEDQEK
jgi:tetratricopeptide (TPR) repeat protein